MFGWIGILIGIFLLILGGYLVFFFPQATDYQPEKFGAMGIIFGFVFLVIGAVLLFIW